MPHDAGSERCADSLDRTGAKIALHRLPVLRGDHIKAVHPELLSVNSMLYISSLRLDALTLIKVGEDSCTGDLHLPGLETDHPVAVLGVFENNVLYITLQFLQDACSSINCQKQGKILSPARAPPMHPM